ncbi:MAG: DUF3795 domain-containing protein [Planctomycetia bacterium]|nr:DUF3795 domain-containing protein [Planctomycetia bacterium]
MDLPERFYDTLEKEATITLATAVGNRVTMRTVSPVLYQGSILIFTSENSKKYQQLQKNHHCCIAAGPFFAEATAKFCGATMRPENKELRDAYCKKFPKAFDEGVAFGGRNAVFILLTPNGISGWAYEDNAPSADGIPTIPFEFSMSEVSDTDSNRATINIAPCGLVCSQCDAFRATQENNSEKLELVAACWRKLNSCDDITAEFLSCDGCMNSVGRKSYFCANMCKIRHCAVEKKVEVCSDCSQFPCEKLSRFLENAPQERAKAMRGLLDAIADVKRNMHSIL